MVKKQLISKEHSDRSYSIEEKKPNGIGQTVQGKIKMKRMGLSNGDTQSKQASIQHNVQGRVPSVPADSPSAGSHMMQSRPVDKKEKRREEKRANRRRALANTLLPLTRKPQEHSDTLRHSEGSIQEHVFTVIDDRDHAETPLEAYRDLEPILFRLATLLGKTKNTLKIYDPYYCAGAVKRNLALLGFTDVYNKNEDFYEVQASNSCPVFDVLITNPPFSGDHMERVVQFAAKSAPRSVVTRTAQWSLDTSRCASIS
ncbi:hypothetical protein CEUSTIGMA_g769.t1 [Chlamydomonas eustigma]|uniref:Uncharacterized protein n=1 Tax=Chlamydomonas eustigma TaxID=1157962 RepID=A0A250WR46_9CHLO|nr:hypothetical protein CEUSTIGMA_g769.t1 [Chlamydomonas eustigma]|eukprot:GAX73315.1 hypothetical protein CEUSTIGMA_g769.t1 [Chlamydomonas eustigma]